MALITNKFYHYDFPEIKPQYAHKFHDLMTRVFDYCKNDNEMILEFLEESLTKKKVYNIKNVLHETELSDIDRAAFVTTVAEMAAEMGK
jgi:hypothetical protein